jgi:hypothetical protein
LQSIVPNVPSLPGGAATGKQVSREGSASGNKTARVLGRGHLSTQEGPLSHLSTREVGGGEAAAQGVLRSLQTRRVGRLSPLAPTCCPGVLQT